MRNFLLLLAFSRNEAFIPSHKTPLRLHVLPSLSPPLPPQTRKAIFNPLLAIEKSEKVEKVEQEVLAESMSMSYSGSLIDRLPWLGSVLLCSLAWGLNFPVSKLAFSPALHLCPGAFDVVRFTLATVSIAPWLVESRSQWKSLVWCRIRSLSLSGGEFRAAWLFFARRSSVIGLLTPPLPPSTPST